MVSSLTIKVTSTGYVPLSAYRMYRATMTALIRSAWENGDTTSARKYIRKLKNVTDSGEVTNA